MKRLLQLLSPVFFVALLLFGCSSNDAVENNQEETTNNQNQTEENQEESVHIIISEDEGAEVHSEKDIEIEENDILLDVLKENFDIEDDGGFITAIDGLESDDEEGKYWMFDVNGEMAQVGANEYELAPGDEVEFDLQVVE